MSRPPFRDEIRFLLNDREVRLHEVAPSDTLLDYLRLDARLTGTKEGCAEGDCGACTVLVGRLRDGALAYDPVCACIRLMPSLDRCHVVTIEHLAEPDGTLHPVQAALVEHHGSQCGFCTPGIVMTLAALHQRDPVAGPAEVETALQGNLCRCTGYAPILRAMVALSAGPTPVPDKLARTRDAVAARLAALADGARAETVRAGRIAIVPASVDDLAGILAERPDTTIVAGATDVGLWVTKGQRDISPAVFVGDLGELARITVAPDRVTLGAAVTYEDFRATLTGIFPHLAGYWRRIGGWQVRAMGTIGGNIANGSPIGDTPPVLIALGASVTLRHGDTRRSLPLEAFFLDYGRQDRRTGEFVEAVEVPRPGSGTLNAAYKVCKRRDEDISAVACGLHLALDGDRVTAARFAFGGMAATPRRAASAEAAVIGQPWSETSVAAAQAALDGDFAPIGDWRASAGYRTRVARNLLRRFWLEARDGPAAHRLLRRGAA